MYIFNKINWKVAIKNMTTLSPLVVFWWFYLLLSNSETENEKKKEFWIKMMDKKNKKDQRVTLPYPQGKIGGKRWGPFWSFFVNWLAI